MLVYLLSVGVIWLGFLALYILGGLQREKFLRLNRFFLMGTLLAGLLIPVIGPWLPSPAPVQKAGAWVLSYTLPTATISTAAQANGAAQWSWVHLLGWIYLVGCMGFGLRLVAHLAHLGWLISRSQPQLRDGGLIQIESPRIKAPFSFLWYLFWPASTSYTEAETVAIEAHERAHIQQWHSIDLLILELTGVFFWWCPLWYMYSRYLREAHEYLADAAALKHTSKRVYGQLLIRQCLLGGVPELAHGLNNHSQLKNRIAMMTKSNSSYRALAKYVLAAPVLMLAIAACSSQRDANEASVVEAFQPIRQDIDTIITFDPVTTKETMEIVKYNVYKEVEEMPVFGVCSGKTGEELSNCSINNLMTHIGTQLKYPESARQAKTEGMVVASFVVTASGRVRAAMIKRGLSPACDEEVIRLINGMPNWQPGKINDQAVDVEMTLPIRFKLD